MKDENFVIRQTAGKKYIKEYYRIENDNGEEKRVIYKAELLSVPERIALKAKQLFSNFITSEQVQKTKDKAIKSAVALLLACSTIIGTSCSLSKNEKLPKESGFEYSATETNLTETSTTETNLTPTQATDEIKKPELSTKDFEPELYISTNGDTCIKLYNAIKMAECCYNEVCYEIQEYNKTHEDKIEFDSKLFSPEIFVGVFIKESSLIVPDDIAKGNLYRGCFKFGNDAITQANDLSQKLINDNIIKSEEDLFSPVESCKACCYVFVKNYEYILDIIKKTDANPVFLKERTIYEYLMGYTNVKEKISNDPDFKPEFYVSDVIDYADILRDYYEQVNKDPEYENFARQIHVKLNAVSEKNKQKLTSQTDQSAK